LKIIFLIKRTANITQLAEIVKDVYKATTETQELAPHTIANEVRNIFFLLNFFYFYNLKKMKIKLKKKDPVNQYQKKDYAIHKARIAGINHVDAKYSFEKKNS
jgi:hypothetical protein